jgi:hypothetical protein
MISMVANSNFDFPLAGWLLNGEREHEEVDVVLDRDLGAQMALKRCVLYKFWALKGMRAQVRFLEMIVGY